MNHKHSSKLVVIFIMFALLTVGAAQQTVAATAIDLNPKLTAGRLAQNTDVFEVIFDATLSMNDIYKNSTKLNQEKALIDLFNDTIPNIRLTAAVRAFGQFQPYGDPTTKPLFGPSDYAKSALSQAIAPFTSGSGFSPLDAALDGAAADLRSPSGQMAVIAFSDGEDMEAYAPVAAARRLKSAYGERICIYTVHLGDSPAGRKRMQQVAEAGQCGFMVTGDSIASPEGMADFVEKVFLKAAPPKPVAKEEPIVKEKVAEAKVQAQAAPEVKSEPVTIALDLQFATGKSNIQPKYHDKVKKVADYMVQYPNTKAVIEGYTDNVGKEAANVKLSQNRANSVKQYLVRKLKIDASRIEAIGYGPKKPVASNATKEGRQQNRRVHAVISDMTK